jgi:hypothetical protein
LGDAIIDHIEKNMADGKKLFDHRFHATDCGTLTIPELDLIDVRQRNMELVIETYNKSAS